MEVVLATASETSRDAARLVYERGGNAVDCAIAAAVALMSTEPGIMAPGCGGFVAVLPPGAGPTVFDGYACAPGRDGPVRTPLCGPSDVEILYGGGLKTRIGYASVAVPGLVRSLVAAHVLFGRSNCLSFADLLRPTIESCQTGFPLSRSSVDYLSGVKDVIFGWHPETRAVFGERSLESGTMLRLPNLAETLFQIGESSGESLYTGDLARIIAGEVRQNGGALGLADLSQYQVVRQLQPMRIQFAAWELFAPNLPSVGGATLAALLELCEDACRTGDEVALLECLLKAQRYVYGFRESHFSEQELGSAVRALLESLGDQATCLGRSASTMHISAVDSTGLACSITASAGYGSGVMPGKTQFLLNNSFGELELVGDVSFAPGDRLPSNMCPIVGRSSRGAVLAIGSPGASRITTALSSVLLHLLGRGISLDEAIHRPRVHWETPVSMGRISYEKGALVGAAIGKKGQEFPSASMYFGGVNAALRSEDGGFTVVADARRAGATFRSSG